VPGGLGRNLFSLKRRVLMPESISDNARTPNPPFKLQDYVETATDASNRSRYLYIILLVTTILIFIGLWNSFYNSWMVGDIREAYRPLNDDYIKSLFNITDKDLAGYKAKRCDAETAAKTECFECCASTAELAVRDIQQSLMQTHTENRTIIRIPILGIPMHVNDLGLFGGVTLLVLLILMRTSLSREIKNLGYSFKNALANRKLDKFYDALARRQLFTIPHMKGEKRNRYLSKAPYAVFLMTAAVYLLQFSYDFFTYVKFHRYNSELQQVFTEFAIPTTLVLVCIEGLFALTILVVAVRCMERHYYIYQLWDYYWDKLTPEPSLCLLEPEVAERYLNDDEINALLMGLAVKIDNGQSGRVLRLWGNLKGKVRRIYEEEIEPIKDLRDLKRRSEGARLICLDQEVAKKFSNDKEINILLLKLSAKPPDVQPGQERIKSAVYGLISPLKDTPYPDSHEEL
jgi:hypothetical protein